MRKNIFIYMGIIIYGLMHIVLFVFELLNPLTLLFLIIVWIFVSYAAAKNLTIRNGASRNKHYVFFFTYLFCLIGISSFSYDIYHSLQYVSNIRFLDIRDAITEANYFYGVIAMIAFMYSYTFILLKGDYQDGRISRKLVMLSILTIMVTLIELFLLVIQNIPSV